MCSNGCKYESWKNCLVHHVGESAYDSNEFLQFHTSRGPTFGHKVKRTNNISPPFIFDHSHVTVFTNFATKEYVVKHKKIS
jgi:hypothetical protein